jgi:oligoendopeptidase F
VSGSAAALADAVTTYEDMSEQADTACAPALRRRHAGRRRAAPRRPYARGTLGIANALTFFALELMAGADAACARLGADPAPAAPRHWLGLVRRRRPFTLSEPEERVVNQKNVTGRGALVQLFDELSGSLRFRLDDRELTGEQILSLLYDPDRALRERAFTTFLDTYAAHGVV